MNYRFVQQVQIILKGRALWAARISMWRTKRMSLRRALRFTGPHFDIRKASNLGAACEVAIGQSTINVIIDKTEYVYPLATVGRAKIVNLR